MFKMKSVDPYTRLGEAELVDKQLFLQNTNTIIFTSTCFKHVSDDCLLLFFPLRELVYIHSSERKLPAGVTTSLGSSSLMAKATMF